VAPRMSSTASVWAAPACAFVEHSRGCGARVVERRLPARRVRRVRRGSTDRRLGARFSEVLCAFCVDPMSVLCSELSSAGSARCAVSPMMPSAAESVHCSGQRGSRVSVHTFGESGRSITSVTSNPNRA
jgi:hypothetical protein